MHLIKVVKDTKVWHYFYEAKSIVTNELVLNNIALS